MVRAKSEFVEVDQDDYPNLPPRLCIKSARISAPVHFGRHLTLTLGAVEPHTKAPEDTLVHRSNTNIVPSNKRLPRIKLVVKSPNETQPPGDPKVTRPRRIILRMPKNPEGSVTALGSPRTEDPNVNERSKSPINKIEGVPDQNDLQHSETASEELERVTAPQLPDVIAAGMPEINFPGCLKNNHAEDPFFKIILSNSRTFTPKMD